MKQMITRRYLAGLLDGEGYFGIMNKYTASRRYYTPAIKMTLTTPDIIKELVIKFEGNVYVRKFPGKNQKDAWCWDNKTWKQVAKVLDYVYPYLIIKRPQAEILKEFLTTKSNKQNYGSSGIPPEIMERRKKLYQLIRKLNYRGVPPAETK